MTNIEETGYTEKMDVVYRQLALRLQLAIARWGTVIRYEESK